MEVYHDFYGCHACIRKFSVGSARLTIRCTGKLAIRKNYSTYRGAKNAMGKWSDSWIRM